MKPRAPRFYRFATPAQWQTCLSHRLEAAGEGLAPIARLGQRATRQTGVDAWCETKPSIVDKLAGPLSISAVDWWGGVWWRRDPAAECPGGLIRDEDDVVSGPFEIDASLARSSRWLVDRRWLWAFDRDAPILRRYDRSSLEADRVIDLRAAGTRESDAAGSIAIHDITRDGRDGVWLLVRENESRFALRHIDCEGRPRGAYPVPCEVAEPTEVASIMDGRELRLVLLTAGGRRLALIDTRDGSVSRVIPLAGMAPCWTAVRITSDTRNRIALWCRKKGGGSAELGPERPTEEGALLLLDGRGDILDGPLERLFSGDDHQDRGCSAAERDQPLDLAVHADTVWFATPAGAWRLDSSEDCVPRETDSTLLTPPLESPERGTDRGWLRAELEIALPAGAVLQAEFATTNDHRVAEALEQVARDGSIVSKNRQDGIWETLEHPSDRLFRVVGPCTLDRPVAIPLFDSKDRWLWLRLHFLVPPGAAGFQLRELRVLYPEISISENLPAIFWQEQSPSGFLRRFLGVLECTTQSIDDRIRRLGSNVNPETAPVDWLDYLARWLDLPWEDDLPVPVKRCVLEHAGQLIDQRGTRAGLNLLLRCLLGSGGWARVTDLTVDHSVTRLTAPGHPGATLPALLAGAPLRAATVGGKAVLGRARVACDSSESDPLRDLLPTTRIEITALRRVQRALEPLLLRILQQYVPAGIRLVVRWHLTSSVPDSGDPSAMVLDAAGPGAVGKGGTVSRTILAGRGRNRIDECGWEVGFRLT